jgi:peroxiredoxin 6
LAAADDRRPPRISARSHPADFTPVCTTEVGQAAKLQEEFSARGVKLMALSCNDTESHLGWIKDIKAATGADVTFPIISDASREIAMKWGMIEPELKDAKGLPLTCRSVFVIGPDKKIKLTLTYPASTGRNFAEIIRVVDSLQLTASHQVATPVDWVCGQDVVILPSVTNEVAATKFPKGFSTVELPSGKPYLRLTPDPKA